MIAKKRGVPTYRHLGFYAGYAGGRWLKLGNFGTFAFSEAPIRGKRLFEGVHLIEEIWYVNAQKPSYLVLLFYIYAIALQPAPDFKIVPTNRICIIHYSSTEHNQNEFHRSEEKLTSDPAHLSSISSIFS